MVAIATASFPVGIDYVAKKIGCNWGTARAILFNLMIDGRIRGQKTALGWVFFLVDDRCRDVVVPFTEAE